MSASDWRFHRRVVTPILNESSIRPHLSQFNEIIKETMAKLPGDNKPFDLMKHVTVSKINMFVRAAFGDSLEPSIRQEYLDGFAR